MRDELHRHGDIDTVLRSEPRHISRAVLFYPLLESRHRTLGDKDQKGKCKENDHREEDGVLTFHCVIRRKTDARKNKKKTSYGLSNPGSLLHL
jgi:hypothetical protein